jgi:hypothetical protein
MRVFLCADATGRSVSIRTASADPIAYIENGGLEIIEEQTEDYDEGDYSGTITMKELPESDAVLFD